MCASTSSISNLVLNQIGPLSATFTITARDEYQNLLDGSSIAVPILAKSVASMSSSSYFDFSKSSLPVVSGSSSEFLLPVSLTISGEYKLLVSTLHTLGLLGVYYKDAQCRSVLKAQVDPYVDFSWGRELVPAGAPSDRFCVRWTGFMQVTQTDDYVLNLESDNEATVSINYDVVLQTGILKLSDPFKGGEVGGVSVTKTFKRDVVYAIKISYFSSVGASWIRFRWRKSMGSDLTTFVAVP
jgi:hypothetical protein